MKYVKLVQTKDELIDPKLDSPAVYFAEQDDQLDYFKVKYRRVDLGDIIPYEKVKWANIVIGGDGEDGYGQYFAWADTEGFYADEMTEETFSTTWYSGRPASEATTVSGETDAAHVVMGGKWRIPTADEIHNLYLNTNKTIETVNGVTGIKFANKNDESKYIFVPLAGKAENGKISNKGTEVYIRASNSSGTGCLAPCISISGGNFSYKVSSGSRSLGLIVLGICE